MNEKDALNILLDRTFNDLQRDLLNQVEFVFEERDSRYKKYKSFYFSLCQDTRRNLEEKLLKKFDLIVIDDNNILSLKIK